MRHACSTVAIAPVGVLSWPGELQTPTALDEAEALDREFSEPDLLKAGVRIRAGDTIAVFRR